MEKNIIRFSYNWNGKLNNRVFTTIRLHSSKKYRAGQTFHIELKGKVILTATIIDKYITTLTDLTDYVCYLDTGYNKADTLGIFRRMYKNIDLTSAKFDLILLKAVATEPQGANDRFDKNE
jgi:hypothetical protein